MTSSERAMSTSERSLRAVRTQVQFEIVQASVDVAQAVALGDRLQRQEDDLTQRSESAAQELRSALTRLQINPALLSVMRRVYQQEEHALAATRVQLASARQRERETRDALAGLRNRDRSLDRAVQLERRRQNLANQVKESARVDDLWLQHAWREPA